MRPKRRRNLALAFLEKYEPKGREETKDRPKAGREPRSMVRPAPQEILPPEANPVAPALPKIPSAKPINIAPLEASLQEALALLDLDEPEGMLDAIFGRPDHRIEKKTERALRLAKYRAALATIIAETRRAIEEASALNRARFAQQLDMLKLAAEVLEARERLNYAAASAARRNAVEEAEAKAQIAAHAAAAEKARLSALPPAPAPTPVAEATRKREEARRQRKEQSELDIDMADEKAAASEEKVARARRRCIAVFQDLNMRAGEKRTRIAEVLEAYGYDSTILPLAVQEFLEEDAVEEEQ